jgi:hypothetical protein
LEATAAAAATAHHVEQHLWADVHSIHSTTSKATTAPEHLGWIDKILATIVSSTFPIELLARLFCW